MDERDGKNGEAGAGQEPARTYINHLHLGVSLSEVLINVGQVSPGEDDVVIKGCFVTSPDYLLSMRSKIKGAIDNYQARFGTIVDSGLGGDPTVSGRG